MEITITFPTEYTKTVMQLYPEMNKKGTVEVVKSTYRERGMMGFYRGYGALLLFSVPKNYVRFGTYSYAKAHLFTEPSKINNFMCGICAGAAESTLVVTPQETLKTKLIHDKLSANPQYKNVFDGIAQIIKKQGFGGMYKGYLATLLK